MSATAIEDVRAWQALDSRGTPTVACEVRLSGGASAEVVVPSGASTGRYEAVERRDGGPAFDGRGVRAAVANVVTELRAVALGRDGCDQSGLDAALRAADGTPALDRLGGNAVLAVSLATWLATARQCDLPAWRLLARSAGTVPSLPLPMVNVVSGGAHAGRALDIQDVLVVPVGAADLPQAIEFAWRVRRATARLAAARGWPVHLVADEGGLAPLAPRPGHGNAGANEAAVALVTDGIEAAGLRPGVDAAIALDVAANQLAAGGGYRLSVEDRTLAAAELVDEVAGWADRYPVVSVEDVLHDDDWPGWTVAGRRLGGRQLLGDDLIATQPDRLARALDAGVNAVLVKVNQAGTLSTAQQVVAMAQAAGAAQVVSARSGDTEDSWLADLAVGWGAGQIKVGSTTRSERTAKWNRLLSLAARHGDLPFAGRSALAGCSHPPVQRG